MKSPKKITKTGGAKKNPGTVPAKKQNLLTDSKESNRQTVDEDEDFEIQLDDDIKEFDDYDDDLDDDDDF